MRTSTPVRIRLTVNDDLFGRLALADGFLTQEQFEVSIAEYRIRETNGEIVPYDRLLIEMGFLLESQAKLIQTDMRRRIVHCPACATRVNVFGRAIGARVECHCCASPFRVPSLLRDAALAS